MAEIIFALLIMYLVPAYCLTLVLDKKVGLFERMIVGVLVTAGLTGIMAYFIGMLGLGYYHPYAYCMIISITGLVLKWRKKREKIPALRQTQNIL